MAVVSIKTWLSVAGHTTLFGTTPVLVARLNEPMGNSKCSEINCTRLVSHPENRWPDHLHVRQGLDAVESWPVSGFHKNGHR